MVWSIFVSAFECRAPASNRGNLRKAFAISAKSISPYDDGKGLATANRLCQIVDLQPCSKCLKAEAAPRHRWCNGCQTAYRRENRETAGRRAQLQAARAGSEAMRNRVIETFDRLADREMNGRTAAEIVRNL